MHFFLKSNHNQKKKLHSEFLTLLAFGDDRQARPQQRPHGLGIGYNLSVTTGAGPLVPAPPSGGAGVRCRVTRQTTALLLLVTTAAAKIAQTWK
jgi:hypothetical protein